MKNSNNSNEEMYLSMGISKTVYDYGCAIEKSLRERLTRWTGMRSIIS